ncbi:MAG: DUF2207 domain-containing protein [Clostridia bacterium]|nr:DUF2207 domain-containing protein [Clostridia bacterium]
MKRTKIKLYIFAFAAVIACILTGLCRFNTISVQAASTKSHQAYNDSYITVDVGADKVLHIVEELEVGFINGAEEFGRKLTAIGRTERRDGGKSKKGRRFIINVKNFSVETDGVKCEAKCFRSGEYHYVEVKNPEGGNFREWTYENQLTYKFKLEYDYDMSDDVDGSGALCLDFFNESSLQWFYHNGDKSDVSKLHVTINMPKDFDASEVSLLKGGQGINDESGLTVEGKTITFSTVYSGINGCLLQVNLDENYFNTGLTHYGFYWVFVVLFAAVVLAGLVLTILYRPRRPLATVEMKPPVLNPIQFSAFWHGYARRRDICTIVLRWAQLGCIKIKKDGRRDLILIKVANLPKGRPKSEYEYFNSLFDGGKIYSSREMRSRANLFRKYNIRRAVGKLLDEFGEPVTYVKGVERAKFFVRFIPVFSLVILFTYFIVLSRFYAGIVFLYMAACALTAIITGVYRMSGLFKNLSARHKLLLGLGLLLGTGIPAAFAFILRLAANEMYLPLYDYIYLTYIAVAWIIASIFVLPKFIGKRTQESQEMYGRMTGFKTFLEKAEVPQMELLLEENPDYYLDVLPYCMIMGLSKKLDKKTEFLQAPEWAEGFNALNFAQSICRSVKYSVITKKKKGERNEKK